MEQLKNNHYNIIIIGAGIAAISAIRAIRESNTKLSILLISDEDRLPYKRTKINKVIYQGFDKDEFSILKDNDINQLNIQLLYEKIINLNASDRSIITQNEKLISADKILITTGKKPNTLQLPAIPATKIHHIYKASDCDRLISTSLRSKSYLVIGGGVEGVEMADQLVKMGKNVKLVHNSKHLLNQHLSEFFSIKLADVLQKNMVEVIIDNAIASHLFYDNGKVLLTTEAMHEQFDEIVLCIGASPNCDIVNGTGIKCFNGIVVDKFFETSVNRIFAAGDVAILPDGTNSFLWHAAEEQGYYAGKNLIDNHKLYKPKSFRLKMEAFGTFIFSQNKPSNAHGFDVIIEENKTISREIYLKNKTIMGIIMMNDKVRSKNYENAIAEGWSMEQFNSTLPL